MACNVHHSIISPAQSWSEPATLQGGARWKEVAKKIGIFALATFVVVGALASLIFIPGAPLYALAGTVILLGLTGSLTGAAAVGAAVGLSLGTFALCNWMFATGVILGEQDMEEQPLKIEKKRNTKVSKPVTTVVSTPVESFEQVQKKTFPFRIAPEGGEKWVRNSRQEKVDERS